MTLRFYRRVSLIPGVRLNASRAGLSVSLGRRGHGTRYARMAAESPRRPSGSTFAAGDRSR